MVFYSMLTEMDWSQEIAQLNKNIASLSDENNKLREILERRASLQGDDITSDHSPYRGRSASEIPSKSGQLSGIVDLISNSPSINAELSPQPGSEIETELLDGSNLSQPDIDVQEEEAPVQGPIPREPEEKLHPDRTGASIVRNIFHALFNFNGSISWTTPAHF